MKGNLRGINDICKGRLKDTVKYKKNGFKNLCTHLDTMTGGQYISYTIEGRHGVLCLFEVTLAISEKCQEYCTAVAL